MVCRKCGANLKDGAAFCTSCGSKVEVIDMKKVLGSDMSELFAKNTELMAELNKNFDAQKEAVKLTEDVMLGKDGEIEKAKAETVAVQNKLDAAESLLRQKADEILEKEKIIAELRQQIANTPVQKPVEAVIVDEARICPNCGNSVKDGMAFCNKCGTKL